ncbi:unnamed protein product [Brassica napus]|uniref:(rape) hypothetical protein n=1 Tax=Brassica napus TaxID=3708 RepID=A0A816SVI4_BRANA|nr:unnamed protein product [Brassica napus]
MVEGVVSFGVEKLWDLLSRETERLQGVHEHVAGLKRRMRTLQSLLKDADAKKHENKEVRNFLEDVKDIVYDAEDIIESFLLKESSGNEKGIKRRVKALSCFLVERRDISIDIEGITKRMSEVVAEMQSFGIKEIMYDGRSLSLKERQRVQREIRQTFPKSSEKGLVGVEESVEELVGHLVKNDNIQVVSISGMGGIGKTTLARQVFHHDIVRRHFDGFAWVCVSKEFRRKDIWQKILQDLKRHGKDIKQAIKQMDENELQEKLFLLLGTRRHLIVLDDVWKNEDWDRIKDEMQSAGWKMILTSRHEGVGLHADPTRFAFTPKILTPEESWKLCERIALSRSDKAEFCVDKELEDMGKKMVTYCGGLPLAVKVLGGLLANKKYTVEEWKRVYDNIQTQIIRSDDNKQDSVYQVLSLSYEDLPMHLKHCFLFLAYFPEDYKISVNKLYFLWAAEGIITSSCDGPTIRESGEEYMEELIRRNMVIVEKSIMSWGPGYCQMHDMMREVCLSKAKEENFLQVIKAPTTSTSTVNAHTRESRRLVLHGGNALNLLGRKSNKKARSVLGFGLDSNLWKQSAQGFRNLQLLRVLDLNLQSNSGAEFEIGRIPSSIGNLIHLRYLRLNVTSGSHLPSSLRNLKLLLYLELSSSGKVYVPNIFKEMVELRYLFLPVYMKNKTKLELGNLVNLEVLGCFQLKSGSITDLRGMTRLRTLQVIFEGRYTSEKILASSLRELRNLEMLSLFSLSESDVAPDVDFIWNFIHLKALGMWMLMPRLPEHSRFPPNLVHISLGQCRMEEDPLPILEKLLHLKSVELWIYAFVGRKMVCSKGGFPQLHKLELKYLDGLEEWEIEEGSMPCLRTLHIKRCQKLKEIPEGLKYIISLKELEISGMNKEWNEKLESGGESYYKVQHIPSVQFNQS